MTDLPDASERHRTLMQAQHLGPSREIAEQHHLSEEEVQESVQLLQALHLWHVAVEEHSEAAKGAMHVGTTDMRAIRYLMACKRENVVVTSGMLAEHLGIAGPSVTKLIDRLEAQGHVRRMPHPRDRRAASVEVTPSSMDEARSTIGQDHARRFDVVAQLTSDERRAAIKVLRELAAIPVQSHGTQASR